MEIVLESKTMTTWQEVFHQTKRIQVSLESVVPDVSDDIGRILSVQPSLLLKAKEPTAQGMSVSGEVAVAILYINELENGVSALRMTQPFCLDYELVAGPEAAAQIQMQVTNTETHILNPRKLSVSVEISGELKVFQPSVLPVETFVPNTEGSGVQVQQAQTKTSAVNAVCEKSFVLSEQFLFPSGKPAPRELVSQSLDFRIRDQQLIGSKVLLKGELCLTVCTLSDEVNYPIQTEFSAPFSQLVDIGQDSMDGCCILVEPTAVYTDLTETMNGEKAINAEIHAVAQLVCHCDRTVSYVSDAYSVLMPCSLNTETLPLAVASQMQSVLLSADERVELPDDCDDVLAVFPSISQASLGGGKAFAAVTADVLYRTGSGTLGCIRRACAMESPCDSEGAQLMGAQLVESVFRPEGTYLNLRLTVELSIERFMEQELSRVVGLTLDDTQLYDLPSLPALTAVRVGEETLWELAKHYHATPEHIAALNDVDAPLNGRVLLIPRGI